MRKVLAILLLIIFFVGLFLLIRNKEFEISSSKLRVTTSIYPIYYFASYIGGEKTVVNNITPAGAEPHDYEPTPQDFINIRSSKLLILNGLVEPWSNNVSGNLKGTDVKVLSAGDGLFEVQGDPHIWLSPTLAKIESEKILDALVSADPTNADYFKQNESSLQTKLDEIDNEYKEGLKSCETRSFVTSHAAFNYLARDYNLTQIAIEGLSPDAEPSLSKLAQISDYVKKNNIKYIFFESLVSPKLSETIANEIGAKTLVLDPIEGITDQNLAKGINYLTLMQANLQNLRVALNCK